MPSSCPNQSVHSNGSHIYWVYCLMLLWFTQNFVSGPSSLRVCSACSYNASPPTSFSDASNADVHLHTNHLLFLASFCFSPPSFSISFALLATSHLVLYKYLSFLVLLINSFRSLNGLKFCTWEAYSFANAVFKSVVLQLSSAGCWIRMFDQNL